MDAIDHLLHDAFADLLPKLATDRRELYRRLRRRLRPCFARPLRAWCLCLRASDTRIRHEHTAIFLEELAQEGRPHTVDLPGWGVRSLVAPVRIDPDGERWTRVAEKLGMDPESLRYWMRRGVFQVTYDYCRPHGYKGKPCPILRARTVLDPNAPLGGTLDPLWRSMWQSHGQGVDDDFVCTVERIPRLKRYAAGSFQRGWSWICPGRPDPATGRHRPCGRAVQRLYSPLTVRSIDRFLGPAGIAWILARHPDAPADDPDEPFDPDALVRSLRDPLIGPRSFACHRCWRIRYAHCASPTAAWNQFVTYITGGLLQGREVPMPDDFRALDRRRRAYRPRPGRAPSARRAQIAELWTTTGMTYGQIAARLGVGYATVHTHIRELYRRHKAHSRTELAQNMRRTAAPAGAAPRATPRPSASAA